MSGIAGAGTASERGPLEWAILDEVRGHVYRYWERGSAASGRAGDGGWHPCSCGAWEGYWSAWQPHVAAEVRAAVEKCGEVESLAVLSDRLARRSAAVNRISVENQELRERIVALEKELAGRSERTERTEGGAG